MILGYCPTTAPQNSGSLWILGYCPQAVSPPSPGANTTGIGGGICPLPTSGDIFIGSIGGGLTALGTIG